MKNEPVITSALATVTALVALLVAFGVELTSGQQAAIGGFCVAVLGLAKVVRDRVWPAEHVNAEVKARVARINRHT